MRGLLRSLFARKRMIKTADLIFLGSKYRDDVTKFEGIATSKVEFLNGCVRVALQSEEKKDGAPLEPQYFDFQQLSFVEHTPLTVRQPEKEREAEEAGPRATEYAVGSPPRQEVSRSGGDRPAPKRAPDPR